jgi:hypothetical protein
VADWHSFRQADTASVTREYVKDGIDLLRPRYQDLSNIQSGKDNLEGYRMVEFPFINAVTAAIVLATGAPLVLTSRFVSVFFSLGSLLSMYGLVTRISGRRLGLLSAGVFAFLPYSVYYSRAILPEAGFLFFLLFGLVSFKYWLDGGGIKWYVFSVVSLALAFLLKPFAVFMGPVFAILAIQTYGFTIWKQWPLALYGLTVVTPLYFWREWIQQFPTGIPASDWLYNSNQIRFRPAWFRWLFWERIGKLMSGYVGLGLMGLNVFNRTSDVWVYGSWWAGMLVYFSVIATGNVQHDYYQVMVTPIVCISLARGSLFAYDMLKKRLSPRAALAIVGTLWVILFFAAWQQVKGYFNVNHWEYVEAGQAVDRTVPADAKVIAPAFGDTHFLFQTNRTGWPIGFEIEDKISKGATHYVTTSDDDEARRLKATYKTLLEHPKYVILDLRTQK